MSNTEDTPMDYKQFEGHTPEPWIISPKETAGAIQILGDGESQLVALVYGRTCDEQRANASAIIHSAITEKENQLLKLELQKQNRRIDVYKSILDMCDNKIHEWQKWEQVKNKELASKDAELQKQKKLNAELVKIKDLVEELIEVSHFRNQWEATTEAFESLIKKSNEI